MLPSSLLKKPLLVVPPERIVPPDTTFQERAERALTNKQPLAVVFILVPEFLGATSFSKTGICRLYLEAQVKQATS